MLPWIKSHRTLTLGLILLLGFLAWRLFRPASKSSDMPQPPKGSQKVLIKPQNRDLTATLRLSGSVAALKYADLRFQTSGRLSWVGVKVGDKVRAWQSVASLDTRELKKHLTREFNDYESSLSNFDDIQDQYQETKERHLLTDEIRRLLTRTQNTLDNAVIDYELTEITLRYATLSTPIAGIVTTVNPPVAGTNITPASASIVIIDPASVYFDTEIDQEDVTKISIGQSATIILDSFRDQPVNSTIDFVDFSPVAGQTTTVYEVRLRLPGPNSDLRYRLGMTGDADLVLGQATQVLSLPLDIVFESSDGQKFVWTEKDNQITRTFIETGLETDEFIQITKGLTSNDSIVTYTQGL